MNDLLFQGLPSGSRVHNCLSGLLSECALKVLTVVRRKVIPSDWLAAILVYSLGNLIWIFSY